MSFEAVWHLLREDEGEAFTDLKQELDNSACQTRWGGYFTYWGNEVTTGDKHLSVGILNHRHTFNTGV